MFSQKIKLFFIALLPLLGINAYAGKITDSSGNMVYSFLVDNPSMVDAYFNIFNAMAQFFQSNDYLELLKVVFLLGGLSVFFVGVMKVYQGGDAKGSLGEFVKYMILGTALLTLIFSHKSQMIIKTNNLPSFCPTGTTSSTSLISTGATTGVVVGNIPEVLAWTFSLINEVGRETTRLSTMGFTAVDADLTTYTNRSDYASYLQGVGQVLKTTFKDLNTKYNNSYNISLEQGLEAIFRDCIAAPAANAGEDGLTVMTAFTNTGNLRQTLIDYIGTGSVNVYLNPTDLSKMTTLITAYKSGGKDPKNFLTNINGNTYTCDQVFQVVNNTFGQVISGNDLVCTKNLKDYWNPETMAIFTGDKTINTAAQAKTIALQAALANEIMDSKNNIAPAELSFAAGKSTAEFVNNSLGTGYYMAQMLPYLQMGMRAVMYAFFPFVFIVILLPGGIKVLISYLQTLIWIELWSPTAAVLNMFLSIMATDKFKEMYQSEGFNGAQGLMTFSDSAMLASVAGYLYASVPALTWLILKGSGQMLGNITGAIGARMASNLNSDSINKDKEQINSNRRVNEERKRRGEEMISLAEQDKLSAQQNAWEAAGVFDQKSSNMDKLFDGSAAKTKLDINRNSVNAEMFLNNPNADKNMGAVNAEQKGSVMKTTEQKTLTGEVDAKGNVNDKRTLEISKGEGAKGAQNTIATQEEMDKTLKYTKGDINKAAQVLGREKFENTVKEMSEEKFQALVHKVDPANADSLAKMRTGNAQTDAMKDTVSNNTEESKQNMLFTKDKNGNFVDSKVSKEVLNTSTATATTDAVKNLTDQKLRDTFNKGQRVEAAVVGESVKIGEASYKVSALTKGLDILAKDTSNPDSAEAKRLSGILNDKNASYADKKQALSQAAGLKSIQGAAGQMYDATKKDTSANTQTNAGYTATVAGKVDSEQILSNETYYGGDSKGTKGLYNEFGKQEGGEKLLNDSAEQLKTLGFNVSNINDTYKTGEHAGELTTEALHQRRLVAENLSKQIKAEPEAFNSSVNNLVTKGLKQEGVDPSDMARSKVTNDYVQMVKTNNVEGITGRNFMANAKTAQELVGYLSIPANTAKTVENLGKLGNKGAELAKKIGKNTKVTDKMIQTFSGEQMQNLMNAIHMTGIK